MKFNSNYYSYLKPIKLPMALFHEHSLQKNYFLNINNTNGSLTKKTDTRSFSTPKVSPFETEATQNEDTPLPECL